MPGEELLYADTVHISTAKLQIMGLKETMTPGYFTQVHPTESI